MKKFLWVLFAGASLLSADLCFGIEKRFVTDSIEITVRTGPSLDNRVIEMLRTGDSVEVLESTDKWTRVRPLGLKKRDKEGWVLTRYIMERVPWEKQAGFLKKENARLKNELDHFRHQAGETGNRVKELSEELGRSKAALIKTRDAYDALKKGSSDFLELKSDHERAEEDLSVLRKQQRALLKENERLKSDQRVKWFATGALILLVGLVIGMIAGKRQKKLKSVYY